MLGQAQLVPGQRVALISLCGEVKIMDGAVPVFKTGEKLAHFNVGRRIFFGRQKLGDDFFSLFLVALTKKILG